MNDKMMMHKSFFKEYQELAITDKKTFKKVNDIIKSLLREQPIAKIEKLKYVDAYSCRIDKKNRLVFKYKDDILYLMSCMGHYDDH